MYRNLESIILASGSPRRQHFLKEIGLTFSIQSASIDESPKCNELPDDFVKRMACEKSIYVSTESPNSWVIGGDTVVCLGSMILGKPADEEEAVALLMRLSGQEHLVKTGFCVTHGSRGVRVVRSVTTKVFFADFSRPVARAYVAAGESMDKAGGYGIQGMGGFLVKGIEGSYSNVVGLPVVELIEVLLEEGVIEPSL